MRKVALDMVYELAKIEPRVVFIGSDLGHGVLQEMQDEMPERFFMEGISEQNVVGMSAGMAMDGRIVYANTIAPFFTRRALDQVFVDLCMHNLNVRLIANGGGMVYSPLGPTHEVTEDLAVMRSIPNMTIVSVADAEEMERFMKASLYWEGPIYIRLAKGFDPIVTNEKVFEIGKGQLVKESNDVMLITTGITRKFALEAISILSHEGIECGLFHMPTLKPFDDTGLINAVRDAKIVITVEEHTILGGLGGACAEVLLESSRKDFQFKRLGVPDVFPEKYGSQQELCHYYKLDTDAIVEVVKKMKGVA